MEENIKKENITEENANAESFGEICREFVDGMKEINREYKENMAEIKQKHKKNMAQIKREAMEREEEQRKREEEFRKINDEFKNEFNDCLRGIEEKEAEEIRQYKETHTKSEFRAFMREKRKTNKRYGKSLKKIK